MNQTVKDLNGQVILVTGGARGLGKALCKELGRAGAHVVIADFRAEEAGRVAEEMKSEGSRCETMTLNLGDETQCEEAIRKTLASHRKLDVLINNAGTDLTVSIEDMPVSEWDRIMGVNLRAPFILSKCALPVMKEQGHGSIVNIVSTAAKRCWPNASAYHASKWGLLGFTHALHTEARPHNVKVTGVICGGMRTPFLLERFPDIDLSTLQAPENVAQAIHKILLLPAETVIPEMTVLPMRETSWP